MSAYILRLRRSALLWWSALLILARSLRAKPEHTNTPP